MALTVTAVKRITKRADEFGGIKLGIFDIDFDSSYPTGGEAIAASNFQWTGLYGLTMLGTTYFARSWLYGMTPRATTDTEAAAGYYIRYDQENAKLMAYDAAGQEADTTDLSGVTARVLAVGY